MKKIVLSIVVSTIYCFAFAQNVDIETAKQIASNHLSIQQINPTQKSHTLNIENSFTKTQNGDVLYHVFNFQEGGFVIVAGDYRLQPIIAYSSENNIKLENNPIVEMWLEGYSNHISNIKQAPLMATETQMEKWNNLINNNIPLKKSMGKVGPLTTSGWNQDRYYNAYCPEDINVTGEISGEYDDHVPNGCVAVSMSQIMYYHRYPAIGKGSNSYVSAYGRLSANFASTTYDYNAMSDVANGYSDALARLIFHCGVAIEMNYSPSGSGSQTYKARDALVGYFNYANTAKFEKKEVYTISQWLSKIQTNIYNHLPLIYAGNREASTAGHAWVCDGFEPIDDTTAYLHFNLGWGSNGNGWYLSTHMAGFTIGEEAIFGLAPSVIPPSCTNDTLTATYGSFYSGPPTQNYDNNSNCSWLISTPNATKINISVPIFKTELENDIVTIYAGNSKSSPIVAILSGDTVNKNTIFQVNASEAFITFISNDSVTDRGFVMTYTTELSKSNYCNTYIDPGSASVIKTSSGTLTNGSGEDSYDNSNACYWRIEPTDATGLWIDVTRFELAVGDELSIYAHSGKVIQAIKHTDRIALYTIDNPPSGILNSPNHSRLYIKFRTDNDKNNKGWELKWGTDVSICDNTAGIIALNTYPNPCKDILHISLETDNSIQSLNIQLKDITGKTIHNYNDIIINHTQYNQQIHLNDLAEGIYILKVTTNKGTVNRKIVVQ
jgi:hypothetical protein